MKALSRRSPVPLGSHLNNLFGDFLVICRSVVTDAPESFVLTPDEVRRLAHRGEKDGRVSDWLQPKDYEKDEFLDAWIRIGSGLPRGM